MKKTKSFALKLIPILAGLALLATLIATTAILLWPSDSDTMNNYTSSQK